MRESSSYYEEDVPRSTFYRNKQLLVERLKVQRPRKEPNLVKVTTIVDKMLHRSAFNKPVGHYYTSGRKVLDTRTVENEDSPYNIDAQRRPYERAQLDRIDKLPSYLKPGRREKPVIGIYDRIHIPTISDPLPKMLTTNTPDYYKMISEILVEDPYTTKTVHIERINRTFYSRLRYAFAEEDKSATEERKIRQLIYLVNIRNEYAKTVEYFNKFLDEDTDDLIAVSKLAVNMAKMVEVKAIQIEIARGAMESIQGCLFKMDEVLSYRRLCKMTLDELAPEYWRLDYEKEKEKLQPIADKAADHVLQMFAYFKLEVPFPEDELEKLVLRLSNTIRNLGPPANYFQIPTEVHLMVKKLEYNTVMALQTLFSSYQKREQVMLQNKDCERDEKKTLQALRVDIEIIKNEFTKRLSQIITIEEETGIILAYWRAVATNPDLLHAFVLIKCLYEEFIGEKAPTKDVVEMLSLLTENILDVLMQINNLPVEETEKVYNELKSRGDETMHEALLAKRLKAEADWLIKGMKKLFEKRFSYPGHPLHPEVFEPKEQKKILDRPYPITPPNRRALKRVLKIFQPTISQEAYLNFMDNVKELEKIDDKLAVVQYPPISKTAKLKIVEPISSSSSTLSLDDDEDVITSSSYIAKMKRIGAEEEEEYKLSDSS